MCITIRQAERGFLPNIQADRKKIRKIKRNEMGFALTEVIVSIVIISFALIITLQVNGMYRINSFYSDDNKNAILVAQQFRYGCGDQIPDNWTVNDVSQFIGESLLEHHLQVSNGTREWGFYYVDKV